MSTMCSVYLVSKCDERYVRVYMASPLSKFQVPSALVYQRKELKVYAIRIIQYTIWSKPYQEKFVVIIW